MTAYDPRRPVQPRGEYREPRSDGRPAGPYGGTRAAPLIRTCDEYSPGAARRRGPTTVSAAVRISVNSLTSSLGSAGAGLLRSGAATGRISLAREHLEQPVDEARLRGVEPAARLRGTDPGHPVDLGHLEAMAGPRGPLDLRDHAHELGRVHVPLERPGVHDLARSHPDLAEVDRLAGRRLLAGLLLELAAGRIEQRPRRRSVRPWEATRRPVSRRDQIGPPGWATSTSTPSPARR